MSILGQTVPLTALADLGGVGGQRGHSPPGPKKYMLRMAIFAQKQYIFEKISASLWSAYFFNPKLKQVAKRSLLPSSTLFSISKKA